MGTMTSEELKAAMDKHVQWLEGAGGERLNLSRSDLSGSNLSWSNLSWSNLSWSNLSGSDLSGSDLRGSNLRGSDLRGSDLSESDLSGAIGLLVAADWLKQTFKHDAWGIIVYRSQGGNGTPKPPSWKWKAGAVLTEVVNPCRTDECGSGVHFSTLAWARQEYKPPYWKCRIRWIDLADVVVPYNTDGKARCGRLELLSIVKERWGRWWCSSGVALMAAFFAMGLAYRMMRGGLF